MPAKRAVAVVGPSRSENDTFIGSLIYKCGMDMRLLQDLETSEKQCYEDIPRFMRHKGLSLDFETQSGRCTFVDDMHDADVVLYLFKIDAPLGETIRFLKEVSPPAEHLSRTRRVILLDDMESAQCSSEQFRNCTKEIDEYLRTTYGAEALWRVIPISAASGDNVLEASSRSPWYTAHNNTIVHGGTPCTVMEAFNAVLASQ